MGDAQFALIQYASTVHVEFTLRALTSRQSVTRAIAAVDFLPRDERLTTRTDLALLKTIHLMRVTVRLRLYSRPHVFTFTYVCFYRLIVDFHAICSVFRVAPTPRRSFSW